MPLVVPGVVLGTAIYVFQIEIEIATGLPLLGSHAGLIAAHVLITIPWTVRLVTASLAGFDPLDRGSGEESRRHAAGRRSGASRCPSSGRASSPAALFGFVISFGNLEMTLFLVGAGRTTLPIAILQYLEWKIDPTIAAVSVMQIVLIGAAMMVTDRYVKIARVV